MEYEKDLHMDLDLKYTEDYYKDVKAILKTTPYIDQLNEEELVRYMVWINERYSIKI